MTIAAPAPRGLNALSPHGCRVKDPQLSSSLEQRIAWHEAELARLRQQQREQLVTTLRAIVGPGIAFNARELYEHQAVSPELRALFVDHRIRTPRQLGKWLRQLCGRGLARIGVDHCGAIWIVTEL
jgi:hypothetical protein